MSDKAGEKVTRQLELDYDIWNPSTPPCRESWRVDDRQDLRPNHSLIVYISTPQSNFTYADAVTSICDLDVTQFVVIEVSESASAERKKPVKVLSDGRQVTMTRASHQLFVLNKRQCKLHRKADDGTFFLSQQSPRPSPRRVWTVKGVVCYLPLWQRRWIIQHRLFEIVRCDEWFAWLAEADIHSCAGSLEEP